MALWYSVLLCLFNQDFVMASLNICMQPCPAWTGTGPWPFGCLHAPWGHRMSAAECDKELQSAHVSNFSRLACLCRLLPGRQTYVIDKKGKVALSFNDQVSVALLTDGCILSQASLHGKLAPITCAPAECPALFWKMRALRSVQDVHSLPSRGLLEAQFLGQRGVQAVHWNDSFLHHYCIRCSESLHSQHPCNDSIPIPVS